MRFVARTGSDVSTNRDAQIWRSAHKEGYIAPQVHFAFQLRHNTNYLVQH
jgi:hypothetical protein